MKKLLRIIGAALSLAVIFAFAGCSDNAKSDFVGEWECYSITELSGEESLTYDVPAEVCILTVNKTERLKPRALMKTNIMILCPAIGRRTAKP